MSIHGAVLPVKRNTTEFIGKRNIDRIENFDEFELGSVVKRIRKLENFDGVIESSFTVTNQILRLWMIRLFSSLPFANIESTIESNIQSLSSSEILSRCSS